MRGLKEVRFTLPFRQLSYHRFYLAFDHNDELYEKPEFRKHVDEEFYRMLAEEVRSNRFVV